MVSRSKLILDFALTIHLLHLIATTFYAHALPTNVLWWTLQAASAALMASLGVWTCQWRELQPISFGGNRRTTGDDSDQNRVDDMERGGGGGGGHADGGGRRSMLMHGRDHGSTRTGVGDDDRGDYELIAMKQHHGGGGGGGDGDV